MRRQIDKTLPQSRAVGRQRDGYARYQDDDAHHRWSKQGGSGAGPAPQTLQRLPTRLRRQAREIARRLAEQMRVCGRGSTTSWPNGTCRYPSLPLVLCCAVLCCPALRRGFQGAIITPTEMDPSVSELDKNTYALAPPNKQGLRWPRVPLMHAPIWARCVLGHLVELNGQFVGRSFVQVPVSLDEVQQAATNPALALAVTGPSPSRKKAARPIVSDLCFFRPLPPKGEALWQTAAMIGRDRHVSSDQEIPEALSIPQADAHMVGPAAMG